MCYLVLIYKVINFKIYLRSSCKAIGRERGEDAPFHRIAYDYSRADWDYLRDHFRDVPWEDIFKLSASTAASEFFERAQVGIDVYIPHRKYQVKPHSSPWFLAACAPAIEIVFFSFVPTINLLNLK